MDNYLRSRILPKKYQVIYTETSFFDFLCHSLFSLLVQVFYARWNRQTVQGPDSDCAIQTAAKQLMFRITQSYFHCCICFTFQLSNYSQNYSMKNSSKCRTKPPHSRQENSHWCLGSLSQLLRNRTSCLRGLKFNQLLSDFLHLWNVISYARYLRTDFVMLDKYSFYSIKLIKNWVDAFCFSLLNIRSI